MNGRKHRASCSLALLLAGGACHATDPRSVSAPASNDVGRAPVVVARVGDEALGEDDLARALAREPATTRARYADPDQRRALVEGLVRFELLAQAAARAGYTRDPDAVHAMKQIAVSKFVNASLAEVARPEAIADEDVARAYAERRDALYTRPAAAHVQHIRVGDRSAAEAVVQAARALPPQDQAGFARLAERHDRAPARGSSTVDLGFVDIHAPLPPGLVSAALALRRPGEVSGVIETPEGFEILRLVERRSAAVSALVEVAPALREQLYRERRAAALEQLVARLRKATPITLREAPDAAP